MASKINVDKIARNSGTPEFTVPTADGAANTFLKTDGSGVLSFAANLTYDGNVLDVKNSGTASSINLYCETGNAHYTKIKSGPHSGATSYTLTLPNKPPTVSGQALTATTAGVASWATAGGGKVLQVIHVTDTGVGDTTTNSTYTNTSTTGSITCSATTSKVFVIINGSSTGYRANDNNQYNSAVCLYETVTSTRYPGGASDYGFGRGPAYFPSTHGDQRFGFVMSGFWLHSPNSTSALTYTVQQRNPGLTSVYWNEISTEAATMTLMEIGA